MKGEGLQVVGGGGAEGLGGFRLGWQQGGGYRVAYIREMDGQGPGGC